MSSLIGLNRAAETVQGYQLQQPADMLSALQYIGGITSFRYSGTVNMQNSGGSLTWQLLINNTTSNTSQFANIGDWVILENNTVVSVCPAASFSALYTQA